MTALVVLEAIAIALLGVLVAGLLRSHAEILRRLHDLDPAAAHEGAPARRTRPAPSTPGPTPPSITGVTVTGEVARAALNRAGERTLLLFLSSGCGTCAPWWDGLRAGVNRQVLPGVGITVVARDPDEESPSLLAGLAPPDVTVLLSSAAWETFGVPGSPYAVLVTDGSITGQGVAHSWDQLASLLAQHQGDVDHQLLAAGIPSRPREPASRARVLDPRSAVIVAAGIALAIVAGLRSSWSP